MFNFNNVLMYRLLFTQHDDLDATFEHNGVYKGWIRIMFFLLTNKVLKKNYGLKLLKLSLVKLNCIIDMALWQIDINLTVGTTFTNRDTCHINN